MSAVANSFAQASIAASTKGYVINLSRKVIVNDDLGAFVGLSNAQGRAAARTIEADAGRLAPVTITPPYLYAPPVHELQPLPTC